MRCRRFAVSDFMGLGRSVVGKWLFLLEFFFSAATTFSCPVRCCCRCFCRWPCLCLFLPSEFSHFYSNLATLSAGVLCAPARSILSLCVTYSRARQARDREMFVFVSVTSFSLAFFFISLSLYVLFKRFSLGENKQTGKRYNIRVYSTFAGAACNQLDVAAKFLAAFHSIQATVH